jgi:hypothetical protein
MKPEAWSDNLGNEIVVRPCAGKFDRFMQPERVKAHKMPCVKISFSNLWCKSARTAVIHVEKGLSKKVIDALKAGLS